MLLVLLITACVIITLIVAAILTTLVAQSIIRTRWPLDSAPLPTKAKR